MFFLCMSHAYAFPCIRNSCSTCLIYLNCVWDFSDCFPLYLFLILFTLVVSMAPKRKSIPARNPLRSGASTSSNSASFDLRFLDGDAHKAFSENFSRRGVHSERQVILADFADTDLPSVIHSRGWGSLCDIPITCPLMLIQEFYSNIHGIDLSVPHFITRVRGMCIPVTP